MEKKPKKSEKLNLSKILYTLLLFIILCSPSSFFSTGSLCIDLPLVSYGVCYFNVFTAFIFISIICFYAKPTIANYILLMLFGLLLILTTLVAIAGYPDIGFDLLFLTAAILYSIKIIRLDNLSAVTVAMLYSFLFLILLSYFTSTLSVYSDEMRRYGTVGFGPNELGFISLTVSVYAILSRKYWILAFAFYGALQSGSRRVLFLLPAITILIFAFNLNKKKLFAIAVIGFATYFALDSGFNLSRYLEEVDSLSRLANFNLDDLSAFFVDEGRLEIWNSAVLNIEYLSFRPSVPQIATLVYKSETMHSHNLYLQFMLEYGLLIGITLALANLLLIPVALYRIYKSEFYKGYADTFLFLASLYLSFTSYSLFDYPFYNYKMLFIYIVMITMIAKIYLRCYSHKTSANLQVPHLS